MDRLGQRVGQHHLRLPAEHRPSQRLGGAGDVAGHRLVGNVEPLYLSLSGVIPAHRGRVDLTCGVGHQLRAGRRQFADIGTDRVEHRGDGVVGDRDLVAAELLAKEIGAVFYNRALADARAVVAAKAEDLDDALHALARDSGLR